MFIRIVKMSFHNDKILNFLENFDKIKVKIRNAPGNRLLELYQEKPILVFSLLIVIGKPNKT